MPKLWLDVETTGLLPTEDYILEVGYLVTDDALMPIEGIEHRAVRSVVFPTHHVMKRLAGAIPLVHDMHNGSGLMADLVAITEGRKYGDLLSQTEDSILALLDRAERHVEVTERYGWTLAGSGIQFDYEFVQHHMPRLFARLGYRKSDVSGLRDFFQNVLGLNLYDNVAGSTHRGDVDIWDHYCEYMAYATATAEAFGIDIRLAELAIGALA